MNKFVIAALSFTAGAAAGFAVGYFVTIEKEEDKTRVWAEDIQKNAPVVTPEPPKVDPAETESPKDDDPDELVSTGPAHIAMPGQKGVNYSKVNEIIEENGYTDPEDIQAIIEDPDNEETYEERQDREAIERSEAMAEYRKRNKNKIDTITKEEWNTNFPDVVYEREDLYYFTTDDVLTDKDGNQVDEEEFIGLKPRHFGWMDNDEECIYIRNNPKETDYQVWKETCASYEWWS